MMIHFSCMQTGKSQNKEQGTPEEEEKVRNLTTEFTDEILPNLHRELTVHIHVCGWN